MSPENDPTIKGEILHRLRVLTGATIVLGVILVALLVYLVVRLGEINNSLCTFRSDLESRAIGAQDYLNNPNKYPGIKIPRSVIQQQLDGQLKTIKSLSNLHC